MPPLNEAQKPWYYSANSYSAKIAGRPKEIEREDIPGNVQQRLDTAGLLAVARPFDNQSRTFRIETHREVTCDQLAQALKGLPVHLQLTPTALSMCSGDPKVLAGLAAGRQSEASAVATEGPVIIPFAQPNTTEEAGTTEEAAEGGA
ncbi:MAG: hypothetical protein WCS85_05705 [Candidatus Peribacteraceae bacterium]